MSYIVFGIVLVFAGYGVIHFFIELAKIIQEIVRITLVDKHVRKVEELGKTDRNDFKLDCHKEEKHD